MSLRKYTITHIYTETKSYSLEANSKEEALEKADALIEAGTEEDNFHANDDDGVAVEDTN